MNKANFKISFLITFILLRSIPVFSQTNLDSLFSKLADAKNDTSRVLILIDIAYEYRYDNLLKTFEYNNHALDLATKINYTLGKASTYCLLGSIYFDKGNDIIALDNYIESLELYTQINDSLAVADVCNYIGQIYQKNNDPIRALKYFNKSLKIFQNARHYDGSAIMLNNIGIIYHCLNNDSLGLINYEQAYDMNKRTGRQLGMGFTCMNIGNIYLDRRDYVKAGSYYYKSLNHLQKTTNYYGLANAFFNIGNYYIHLRMADSAHFYLSKSLTVVNNYKLLGLKAIVIMAFSELYSILGDYKKENEYLIKYTNIQDSLYRNNISKINSDIEEKFEFECKMERQEFELIEKSRELKINKLQIIVLFTVLIALFFISWTLIKQKKIKIKYINNLLSNKNNELINLAIYILQKNDLINEFRKQLIQLQKRLKVGENKIAVENIINSLIFKIAISKDIEEFRDKLRNISKDFYTRLEQKYPDLTDKEKQLAVLLRLNLSSKQIGVILNNTSRSIDTSRYMLRKKIGLDPIINLSEFLNSI